LASFLHNLPRPNHAPQSCTRYRGCLIAPSRLAPEYSAVTTNAPKIPTPKISERLIPRCTANHPGIPKKSRQKITTKRHLSRRPSCRQQKIVCNYLFGIFDKLGVSTRVELVLYSLQDRSAAQVELAS
jgi:hypothetical protein